MPSPSVSTFSFPSTTEPVFSVSTSEPVFESPNHSQTSQTTQSQQLQQYHTTTVSNNNAKFPYLKKEEYETWAMKMEYWIMNSDHNLWNIVLNRNSRKRIGRDPKGNIMILPPVSVEEHIAVQKETKARAILLQSLPKDHMVDFHHLDDARDIWLAVKARFGGNDESKKMRKSMLKQEFSEFRVSESEGLHKGYDRFQKILSQLNQMQAKPDNEDCNMKFLRALPPSWKSLESMPKPVIIEPKTSEYASCKSNLSAESPEFFPKSVCARNESVRKADNPRKNNKSPRGNKRSWNGMMTQKLGENFEFNNKACYVCGRFSHLHYTCKNKRKVNDQKQVTPVWNNSRRVNHQNSGRFSHPSPKSNMVPQALLTKSGLVYVNSLKRLFQKKTPNYNRYFNRSVNSVKDTRVHTARPKTEVNTVKASASWVWKPKQEVIDHVSKSNNASKTLTRYDYVDAYGRFKTVLAWDFKRH
ncbi:hypothetical protein Tco_1054376 [Tanacetum coccineum]|uniref:Uncharacterized protein n=1 Tax=Tanacetum coccineum TaxID=301880 RepID=A0ABQ5GX04_9ASTR